MSPSSLDVARDERKDVVKRIEEPIMGPEKLYQRDFLTPTFLHKLEIAHLEQNGEMGTQMF